MTKKHYEAIAKILDTMREKCEAVQLKGLAQHTCEDFANYLQEENPRFDRARFLQACGLESN